MLIAIEGLDQAGKGTQAELLRARFEAQGEGARVIAFPRYRTTIGKAIAEQIAIRGERSATAVQLLCIADRYAAAGEIVQECRTGTVICDRYAASSMAYGEALGVDTLWMRRAQQKLPVPDVTILLDIDPEESRRRKPGNRDRYEHDHKLLRTVRSNYLRMSGGDGWCVINGSLPTAQVSELLWGRIEERR